MRPVKFRAWIYVAIGSAAMLLLQLHFVLFWGRYYSLFPLPGYERAMADGIVPPFFTSSIQSFKITMIILFLLPILTLFSRENSWFSTLGLWSGVMLSVAIIWLATKQLREDSNMWPIDLAFLSLVVALPLLLGALFQVMIKKMASYLRRVGTG